MHFDMKTKEVQVVNVRRRRCFIRFCKPKKDSPTGRHDWFKWQGMGWKVVEPHHLRRGA